MWDKTQMKLPQAQGEQANLDTASKLEEAMLRAVLPWQALSSVLFTYFIIY